MQNSDPALAEGSAGAVGDTGGDTKLACVNCGSKGLSDPMCQERRGFEELWGNNVVVSGASSTIFMCCKISREREARAHSPNLTAR